MPPEQILQIAQVLGVSVKELLGEDEIPNRSKAPTGKLKEYFEQVRKLPRRQQNKIIELMGLYLAQHKGKS